MLRFPSSHTFFEFSGYPGYFQEMPTVLKYARQSIPKNEGNQTPLKRDLASSDLPLHEGEIYFWPGFAGGGILALPAEVSYQTQYQIVSSCDRDGVALRHMYGTSLGNFRPIDRSGYFAGESLLAFVTCVEPRQVPALAVKYGLAPKVPEPRVKVTIEHLTESADDRWLLIVPKADRKRPLRHHDRVSEWFAGFDVKVGPTMQVPTEMRAAISDWFDDGQRPMQTLLDSSSLRA